VGFWRLLAGFGLVILGLVGLIMPIMPGWIFLIPGLLILAERFPSVHRLVEWAKAKAGIDTVK
jgi:uncharacterized membrane protein YbaN (DUF454 family)